MRRLATYTCAALALVSAGYVTRQAAQLVIAPGLSSASALPAPSNGSPAFGNFVRTRSPQLQFCYEDTRAASPSLVRDSGSRSHRSRPTGAA